MAKCLVKAVKMTKKISLRKAKETVVYRPNPIGDALLAC